MPESTNPFDSFDEPQTNAFDQFDAPAQKPAGVGRKAADLGLSVAKGVVAVPQAAVGLADLVTGGAAGRAAESVGVRFQDAQDVLTGMQSDDLKAKRKQFADADGVLDKVGVAVTNPSLIANTVAESLPSMGAGAGIGRGVLMAAPRLGAAIAAGVGEGAVQAGQAAEQIRQEDPHGELSAKQAALAAGSGLVTGAIGAGAGRVADALGTGEATQMLVRGTRDVPAPKLGARAAGVLNSTAARVAKGAINEGLLEEVPQSISEQMFQNAAQDKPLSEGVTDNAVMGGLTGGVMGGVAGGISRQHAAPPPAGPLEEAARLALPAPVAYADAEGRVKMDGVPSGGFDTGTQQGTRSEAQPQPVQPLMLRGPQVEVDAQGNARAPGQIPQAQAGETPLETGNFGQGRNSEDVGMRRLPPPTVNVDSAGIARAPGQNVQPRPQREPGPLEAGAAIAQGRNSEAVFPRPNGPQALPGPDISVDGSGRAATPPQRDAQRRQQDAGFQVENDRRASLGLPQLAREGDILAEDGQPFRNGVAAARAAKAAGAGFRAVRVNDREFVVRRDTSDVIDVPAKDVSGSLKVSREAAPRTVDDGAHQAAASPHNDRPAPTKNQILAGNAKLGHAKLGGLGVSFESPAGSVREDKQNTPPKWKTPMAHGYHYGYFKRTEAADSSEAKRQGVDAFVKEGLPEDYSGPAFVVDQVDPKTGAFDEHKVIVGPANEREALAAYGKHYEAGWKGGAHVTRMEWPAFKDWVRSGKKELPAVIDPSAPAAAPAAAVPASSEGPRADAAAGGAGVPAGVAPPAAVAPAPKPAKAQPKGLRVGTTPGDAEPVTVRDGVVYVGNYAAVNFDSGDEVRVPPDANPMQIRKALQDSGALTKKQKFFGMGEAVAPAPASQQNADVGTKPGVAVPSPVDGLVVTSVPSAPAPDSTTAAPSQGAGSQQASAATPAAAPAAPSTTRETKAAPPTGGDDLHGFMAGAAPFVLARVKKTLTGVVRNDGRIIQRKALIGEMVADGGNVTGVLGARRLAVPSGAFLGEDQITKTGMDYAVHLIGQRGAAAAPAAAPQAKTPEQLRSELQQVEADILRAAPPKFSAGGGDVEAAAKHRNVPADLKQRRKDLKDQLRTGQAPAAPAQQAAVHQDPGQPAEPATAPVVAKSLEKAAAREQRPLADMRKDLLKMVDSAIETAKTGEDEDVQIRAQALESVGQLTPAEQKEFKALSGAPRDRWMKRRDQELRARAAAAAERIGFITFDVPGDGKFKVLNERDRLAEFRKKVETSPGFKQSKRSAPAGNDGVQGGSTSARTAVQNMAEEGDFQAALDYAAAKGVSLDDLKLSKQDRTKLDAWLATKPQPTNEQAEPEPHPLEYTPKQFHDAMLKYMAERNGVTLAEVRENYDTEAGRAENEQKWADAVRQAAKDGSVLTRAMLDKLEEIRPGAVQSLMHDFPDATFPDGYQIPTARKTEAQESEARKANRRAAGAPGPAEPVTIQDLGEKIGGARKDTAVSTGSNRRSSEDDGRATWAKRFKISQIVRAGGRIGDIKDEGRWVINDSRNLDWMKQPKQVGRNTFATKEEAEAFLPIAAVSLKHRAVPSGDGKYEIWRTITDRKRVKVVDREFASRDDAMAYMAQNAAQILETNTTFGEADLPLPPDRARSGAQRRTGNVKGEDFLGTFGLRGVEFGNWNNQDERQALMNDAYDGLMDLADVLSLPPKAMGLNGDLSLAFGARGHGLHSARAHYESERAVINLTKEHGAGSLAHEWFHALDHYFGRQDGKAPSQWKEQADGTRTLVANGAERDMASHGFQISKSGVREEVRKAYEQLVQTIFKKGTQYVEDTQKADEFTGRAKEDLARDLDALRKDLAEQKNPAYWKRNNKPASAEQLAEFDAIAQRMIDGEAQALSTDWRSIEAAKKIAHRWTNDSLEQVGAIYKAVRGRTGFDSTNRSGVLDRLRSTMERYSQRLKQLAEAQQGTEKTRMVPTEFAMNARELDQGRGGDYWTTPHEMAARAFQGFVEDKIAEAGGISRFLNYAPENVGILTPWGAKRPYPAGQERTAINAALDRFVKTLQTKETDRGTALFSRAGLRRGGEPADPFAQQRVTMIRQAVENYAKDWKVSPEIHVIGSLSEAPPEVLSELGVQNSQGASGETDGFYWNGGVYLIAGNIKDATHARRVLFHEALGHWGLRSWLGDDLVPILRQLATMRPQLIARKAKQYGLDLSNESDRMMAAEEVLAELAQERPQLGWVQRAIAAIRRWLRAHGANLGLSDNDVIANYILPARGFVERGQAARTEMADGAVQSKTGNKDPFYSALERQVDQLPAKAMAGDGWASAITGMVNKGAVKADEVEWSGIRDWLSMQEGKVPKEAVQQFLADNGVRVTEVLKGGVDAIRALDDLNVKADALGYRFDTNTFHDDGYYGGREIVFLRRSDETVHQFKNGEWLQLDSDGSGVALKERTAPEPSADLTRIAEEIESLSESEQDGDDADGTRYSNYTLPGGENYREMLLTLPSAATGATPELIERINKRLTDKGYDGLHEEQRAAMAKGGNAAMGMLEDLSDRVGISTEDVQREMAGGDPNEQYRSNHWSEPNILAHIRMNDRTDADGKKVLFIEELQSDWAQEGRRNGFMPKDSAHPTDDEVRKYFNLKEGANPADYREEMVADLNGRPAHRRARLKEVPAPRGPFVDKTDAWLSLALKRIVKYAADNGYERVAFVNGKQSADRYDLSKQVDEVMVERTGDTFNVAFKVKGSYSNDLRQNGVTAEKLVDVVGKEVAEKIADAPQGRSYLSNTDLKVGGEGMKAFYDKIVPAALNKLLPRVGGEKVGEVRIPKTEAKVKDLDWKAVRADMREVAHGDLEFDEFRSRHGLTASIVSDEDLEALDNRDPYSQGRLVPVINGLVDSMKAKVAAGKAMKQSGFDVTDAMRSATASGLPMFSRAGALHTDASTFGALTKDQEQSLKNVGGIRAAQTVRERFDELRANLGLKITQGLFDQFAPIKALGQKEYMLARMSKAADGTMEAALLYGKPFLRDGVADVDVKDGGFAKVMATLKGEHDRFLWWVAAQRASRLKAEGRENLFTDADISNLKTLNAGAFEDGSARAPVYAAALKDLNAFNESTLKLAMESGLINADAFEAMRYDPYVPFYRLMEDGEELPKFRAGNGMVNQQAFKKLKGGAEKLNNDLLQNLLLNWSHLYTASAKNRAAQASMEAAVKMAVAYPVEAGAKGAVKVMQDGKAVHYQVEDPYLLEAITAMHYVPSPLLKPLSATKNLLTLGVTANPAFKIRNLIRDSIAAVAQADLGYNPLKNVADGWKATARDSQTYASMLAAGGLMRFGTNEDSSRVRRQIEKFGAEQVLNESGWRKLTGQMANLWETYQELGDRGENVNRAALYEKLIAQGKSHAEASFMARDLMDFSMGGRWGAVRFLAQTVPFLNARLVGLQRLAQGAKDDPRRFAAVSGAVMLASLALLAAYGDDDDWKRREDWDRDAYWWFKIGDTAFRIPKPFEIGAMGTLAERTAELMMSDEMTGKRFGQRLSNMLFQTFSFDPTPQMFKPLLDVYANKDSFTGRPIEGMSDERLRPQDRVGPRTSEAGRLLGQLGLPDPAQLAKGQYTPLSPKQVDFLLRGYFGWFGTVAQSVSDYGFRPLTDQGVKPAMQLRDVFLAGNFVEALPSGSSRYVSTMYDQAKDIEQAYASYHAALKAGEPEKAAQILAEDGQKIRSFAQVVHMKRAEAQINAQVRSIEESRTLSATEKRDQISALQQRKEQIARPLTAKP